jgi:hypothetical protein
MNANELADALDNLGHNYTNQTEIAIKSATMLRQQQAQIEALKAAAKPVAWIDPNDRLSEPFSWNKTNCHTIPLYTHPADLTDEEIWDVIENHMGRTFLGRCYRNEQFELSKAILRKAQQP